MTSHPSDRPVSALRARMIEDMQVRGFSEKTRNDYIRIKSYRCLCYANRLRTSEIKHAVQDANGDAHLGRSNGHP
jgi:hypothetical protein